MKSDLEERHSAALSSAQHLRTPPGTSGFRSRSHERQAWHERDLSHAQPLDASAAESEGPTLKPSCVEPKARAIQTTREGIKTLTLPKSTGKALTRWAPWHESCERPRLEESFKFHLRTFAVWRVCRNFLGRQPRRSQPVTEALKAFNLRSSPVTAGGWRFGA